MGIVHSFGFLNILLEWRSGSMVGSDIKPMCVYLEWLSRVVLGIPNNKWESIFMDFNVCLPLGQIGINVLWVVVH